MVVKNAFGRLKGRWRCLLKWLDYDLSNVNTIVASCIVLHNMCKQFGDHCLEDWIDTSNENITHQTGPSTTTLSNDVRKVLTKYLAHH